jgi:hypothetical protein
MCAHQILEETKVMKDNQFDIKQYRERWKAVEEIEAQELRALTAEQHWRQINALARFAIGNNLSRSDDDGEMQVFLRWAKLRNRA